MVTAEIHMAASENPRPAPPNCFDLDSADIPKHSPTIGIKNDSINATVAIEFS